ncbi:T9SS type A sorting domain-containing protein [uncultured Cytophaga sp.]|uniref:T9SS type A sorting domain-containing protein n=1 Tax=uncultured Cytophaga sp. TaxID=160238 RepID=UPI00261AF8D2|nr:T9SS type A sorting domain-containing protein [uncultured Cytophaga sp.]
MGYLTKVFAAILFSGIITTKIHAQTDLYIKEKSGVQTQVSLTHLQAISFQDGNVTVVQTDNSKTVYPISNLRYLSFTEFIDAPTDPVTTSLMNATPTGIRFYPNPVNERLFVQSVESIRVDILNVIGEFVLSQTIAKEGSIDVSGLSQGVYICKIQQGANQSFIRIIKE